MIENNKSYFDRLNYFINEEVERDISSKVDEETRYLCKLSVLIGLQGVELFEDLLREAIKHECDPLKIREIIYQSTDYVGYGKTYSFLKVMDKIYQEENIYPIKDTQQTTIDNRLEKGIQAQVTIFGETMKEAWKKGKINYYLASNCFGDYYTREVIDLKMRELITFCFLMAQGLLPQLKAHIQGNINMGNNVDFLKDIVLLCLPYIGYPKSLNALGCINEV